MEALGRRSLLFTDKDIELLSDYKRAKLEEDRARTPSATKKKTAIAIKIAQAVVRAMDKAP